MRDPVLRAKLLSEGPEHTNPVLVQLVKRSQSAYRMGNPPVYEPKLADRIDQQAAALGVSAQELAYDYLLEDEGRAILYAPNIYAEGPQSATRQAGSQAGSS
ncbi:MAG: hypothetical protein ABW039_04750 [Sphingobium sp.]